MTAAHRRQGPSVETGETWQPKHRVAGWPVAEVLRRDFRMLMEVGPIVVLDDARPALRSVSVAAERAGRRWSR